MIANIEVRTTQKKNGKQISRSIVFKKSQIILNLSGLCNGLMSLEGYNSIEPLGGFSDKGRDAIHVNKSNETTIFAYSVREDWRAKLAEDAEKVHKHGHVCNQLIFITTAKFTPNQRDEAITSIRKEFGWQLDLFGVERLQNPA